METTPISWRLRVPEIEALSPTYKHGLDNLRYDCKSFSRGRRKFPNSFYILEKFTREDGLGDMTGPMALTRESLDAIVLTPEDHPFGGLKVIVLAYRPIVDEEYELFENSDVISAIRWFGEVLGVSPCFFDGVLATSDSVVLELPPRRREIDILEPRDCSLNGVYTTKITDSDTTVWFSHRLDRDASIYVVDNLGVVANQNLLNVFLEMTLTPSFMAIDALLCNDEHLFHKRYSRVLSTSIQTLASINAFSMATTLSKAQIKERNDYYTSMTDSYREVHVIEAAYSNKRRILELLKAMTNTRVLLAAWRPEKFNPPGLDDDWSTVPQETISLLKNMENTLSTREEAIRDSMDMLRTMMNLRVAISSSQLAADARKDSSSMTTIALVTMVFLPGSVVASFFSTQFVRVAEADPSPDLKSSSIPVQLSGTVWLYFAITGALTVIVIAIWSYLHGSLLSSDAGSVLFSSTKNWVSRSLARTRVFVARRRARQTGTRSPYTPSLTESVTLEKAEEGIKDMDKDKKT
ncbi:hypothetical protein BKA70DRAFT_1420519 [Coprinopsis sp. MPI-PUGE-AT-0042]|nr:hypothetical protein BKA70DRAFT_1420519 [Coprinopsis sp. MPI-PUGE-AT-0042]